METTQENILVVPELPPHLKHATIFERFDALKSGETLVIINDHDPKPLFYQLKATRGDSFSWEYLENGPDAWKIKITNNAPDYDVLNATLIEPRIKHQTIFEKFDSLKPGEAFVLLNDHDPKPLYYQLSQIRGDIFTWEYLQQGPYEFRILITKKPVEDELGSASVDANDDENIIRVMDLEPPLKHPTIFKKFDELKPGEGLTIYNDHDPKPLYYQMQAERGDVFTWEYLEQGPELYRIHIVKKDANGFGNKTVGDVVAEDLNNAEVFKKYNIDFCCGGDKTLNQVCQDAGVSVTVLEKELRDAANSPHHSLPYNEWGLDFLADYIVNTHHSYQYKKLPDLKGYAAKVATVHGERHPELYEINDLVQEVVSEIEEHNKEEEEIVFPYIKKLFKEGKDNVTADESINERMNEHDELGEKMHKIRHLANNYALPDDACASYSYLFKTLDEFEDDLHTHIHLENNILFPKAKKLEKGEAI